MLEVSPLPGREVVLITDFQKTGWDGRDDVRLPAGTTLIPIDVSERGASNVAITGVDLSRDYEAGRERVVAAARLVNKGTRPVKDLDVTLEVDGRPVRQQRASLAANTAATVTFDAFPLPADEARAAVRDARPTGCPTTTRSTSCSRRAATSACSSSKRRARRKGAACTCGARFRSAIARASAWRRSAAALGRGRPGRGARHRPERHAAARGPRSAARASWRRAAGLLVVLGEHAAAGGLAGGGGGACFPARSAPPPTVPRTGAARSPISTTPTRCSSCSADRAAATSPPPASSATVRWTRRTACWRGSTTARSRSRRRRSGRDACSSGRPPSTRSGATSPLQPVFLPFVHQLVRHAAGHVESRPWHTVGEALDLSAEAELRGPGGGGRRARRARSSGCPRGSARSS